MISAIQSVKLTGRKGVVGMGKLYQSDLEMSLGNNVIVTQMTQAVNWARKYSFFIYPFITACCGMEFMSVAGPRYDLDRFGAAFPRFSPRQADLLMVVGTISHKQAPILVKVYNQMTEPKWVVAYGVCTVSGGFYDNYTTVMGIDTIIPVDLYIPGCPPRPEMVIDGLINLQQKVQGETLQDHVKGPSPVTPAARL
jgi:NADH-quinone oxidoreductase subunit B|tara:strand:+ start:138 stop:725 length:588 start_codon:yes stop_codon:yes gene_type:complete